MQVSKVRFPTDLIVLIVYSAENKSQGVASMDGSEKLAYMQSVEKILKFIKLTHRIRSVERMIYYPGNEKRENDAEHQYQLAMLAWYIIDTEKFKLDKLKVLQYALGHDVVEIHAGDTYFFGNRKGKEQRERKAAIRLKKDFQEFKDLHRTIQEYEARTTPESKFVYALDKLITTYNNYLAGGKIWRDDHITLPVIIEKKKSKIAIAPELEKYFEEIVRVLKKNEKK